MFTSFKALFIAWFLSAAIIGGGGYYVQELYYASGDTSANEEHDVEQGDHQLEFTSTSTDTHAKKEISRGMGIKADAKVPSLQETFTQSIQRGILPINALPALMEQSESGPLPKRAGEISPFTAYGAPDPSGGRGPRIALMVTNMGMSARLSERAIQELPSTVSLSFSPYGRNLDQLAMSARRAGHEVFLMLPMEPLNYPKDDPGALALLIKNSNERNIANLKATMTRLSGFVGVTSSMGTRFSTSVRSIRPILAELNKRGLMYVDSRETQFTRAPGQAQLMKLPVAINERFIDLDLTASEISQALTDLEDKALQKGIAIGFSSNKRIVVDTIKIWADTLSYRGITLVPVSSLANAQRIQ